MLETECDITQSRQCELLGLSRSGVYYQPVGETATNVSLMHRIDELFTARPYFGSRRITEYLLREGHAVNRKRIRRLMQAMGLEAIYPKPNVSRPNREERVFPYLLDGLDIVRPNQVWSTDITYLRLRHGFAYLVALMDWYSRYVLSWRLSNTLDTPFCVDALTSAIEAYGCPDIV